MSVWPMISTPCATGSSSIGPRTRTAARVVLVLAISLLPLGCPRPALAALAELRSDLQRQRRLGDVRGRVDVARDHGELRDGLALEHPDRVGHDQAAVVNGGDAEHDGQPVRL